MNEQMQIQTGSIDNQNISLGNIEVADQDLLNDYF